jgi:hypothetical protein
MTIVFIGGSRRITKLSPSAAGRLDNIIRKGFRILIGDADGADTLVQEYLAGRDYQNVVVYCVNGHCRNNAGQWDTRTVAPDSRVKDFNYYVAKDIQMAADASHGFMLWDAKSNGTLNNMINLLSKDKKVLVYFSPEKTFYTLVSFAGLCDLLAKCDKRSLQGFERKLHLARVLGSERSDLLFA